MVSFGDLKHEPVKTLQSLLDALLSILALPAKCTIHDVCALHEHHAAHTCCKLLKKYKHRFSR